MMAMTLRNRKDDERISPWQNVLGFPCRYACCYATAIARAASGALGQGCLIATVSVCVRS